MMALSDVAAEVEVSVAWAGAASTSSPCTGILSLSGTHLRFRSEDGQQQWKRLVWAVRKVAFEPPSKLIVHLKLWETLHIQCLSDEDAGELRASFDAAVVPVTVCEKLYPFAAAELGASEAQSEQPSVAVPGVCAHPLLARNRTLGGRWRAWFTSGQQLNRPHPCADFLSQADHLLERHPGWRLSSANAKYKVCGIVVMNYWRAGAR